ncbi:hypothetical protein [Kroppenstedtia sanguinis]
MSKWVKGILLAAIPALLISVIAVDYTAPDSVQVSSQLPEMSNPGGT